MPAPLPPGQTGLPLIGETLAFLADGFRFVHDRAGKHGPVFQTRILGRRTAVITTPDASQLWIDPERICREGAMPPNIQELFGGTSLPLLDGSVHRGRKLQVLAGFTPAALLSYRSGLEDLIQASLARWSEAPEIGAVDEAKRLALEGIARNVLNLRPGEVTDRLRADYNTLSAGFGALPLDLPGTTFNRAKAARDRIFAVLDGLVRDRRKQPGDDGLSLMLAARAEDGTALGDTEARLELHHAVVAGYIIYAELVALLLHLHREPEILAALRDEVARAAPTGPIEPKALAHMPYLLQVVMETKRLCPILPAVFGRARRDFEWKGRTIPAGWMVLWGWRTIHLDPSIYPDPERFDPRRFAPDRAEHRRHEHAFTPQGPGPATSHRCPGVDYATLFMQLFTAHVVREYAFEVPAQRLDYVWKKTPPEPRDGLRLRVRRRA